MIAAPPCGDQFASVMLRAARLILNSVRKSAWPSESNSRGFEAAFAGNRLLGAFASEARGLIESGGDTVELAVGDGCSARAMPSMRAYFPYGPTIGLADRRACGRPIRRSCVDRPRRRSRRNCQLRTRARMFARAEVQVGGTALRIPMQALEDAKRRSAIHRQPVLPILGLSAVASDAVGCLQHLPLDRRSAPRAGC